jgi:hypothetical protein
MESSVSTTQRLKVATVSGIRVSKLGMGASEHYIMVLELTVTGKRKNPPPKRAWNHP